jgi:hypothetical protein
MNKHELVMFVLGLDFIIFGILLSFVFFGFNYLLIIVGIITCYDSLFNQKILEKYSIPYNKRNIIVICISFILLLSIIIWFLYYRPELFTLKCIFLYSCL